MASIVDEAGVELNAESSGLAAEIRAEVNRAMTEALAGQDRTVQIDVAMDQASMARMREQLRRLEQQQINPMLLRIRLKVTQLSTFILQRLNAIFNRLKLRITQANQQVDTLARKLRALPGHIDIGIAIDTAAATARLDAWLAENRGKTLPIDLDLDTAGATTKLEAWLAEQAGEQLAVGIELDTAKATTDLQAWLRAQRNKTLKLMLDVDVKRAETTLRRFVDKWAKKVVSIKLDLDTGQFYMKMARVEAFLKGIKTVKIEADTASALAKIQTLVARVRYLTGRRHVINIKVDIDGMAIVATLQAQLAALTAQAVLLRAALGGGGAGGAAGGLSGAFGSLGSVASSAASAILGFGVQLTAILAIAGAVTFAVGAVGAALTGLPAALVGIGAAAGVAALAFDGFGDAIKEANTPEELKKQQEALAKLHPEAAKVARVFNSDLRPAFDGLKREIQGEFFKGLDEPFRQLATTIRNGVRPGLLEVAKGMNNFVRELLKVVTGEEGVRRVRNALSGAKLFIDQLTPAVSGLVRSFLDLAGVPAIVSAIGGMFGDVIGHVTRFFDEMNRSGEAQKAITALRGVVSNLAGAFVDILRSATRFFTESAPGFNSLVTSAKNLATSLIDDLGGAFNTALQAASDFIDNIPQSALDGFKQGVNELVTAFQEFANSPAPGQIVEAINGVLGILRDIVNIATTVSGAIQTVDDAIAGMAEAGNDAFPPLKKLDELTGAQPPTLATLGGAYEATGDAANSMGDKVGEGAAKVGDAAPVAQAGAERIVNGVRIPLERLPGITQQQIDALNPVMKDSLARAMQTGITEVSKLPADLQAALNPAPPAAGEAVAPTGDAVRGALDPATGAADAAGRSIVDAIRQSLSGAGPAATQALAGFPEAVKAALDGAASQAEVACAGIVEAMRRGLSRAPQIATEALRGVTEAVRTAMSDAEREMRDGALRITTAAKFEGVATSAEQAMARIPATVQVNLQTSLTHAQTYGGQITQTWQQTLQQLEQMTQQTWQRLVQTQQQGGQQSLQIHQQLAQQIQQIWQQMGEIMYQAGYQMMIRLAQGIQQGGQQAIQAAQQVAQAIQGLFPMSPPKWGPLSGDGDPQKSGGRISTRLAEGMAAEAAAVEAAAATLAARVAGSLDGASPAARASAVAGASMSTPAARASTPAAASSAPTAASSAGGRVMDMSPEEFFNLQAAATRAGMDGVEMPIRDDGRGGRGRIAARQERQFDRRVGSRGAR